MQHETQLAGISAAAPTLLKLPAQDFLPLLLADLKLPDWRERLAACTLAPTDGLRLWLPMHQTFHVALLDAHCLGFGKPRLDANKIDSMGLVIRRVLDDGGEQGWMRANDRILGWQALADDDLDPDPARRPSTVRMGPADLKQRLARVRFPDPAAETVAPLFVAPPEVCAAAGRTLLYGLIPVTSSERPEAGAFPDLDVQAFADHLSPWLKTDASPPPKAGGTLTTVDADGATEDSDIAAFMRLLGQLEFEFEVFGGSGSNLHPLLNEVDILIPDLAITPLGDWLNFAASVLLRHDTGSAVVIMPPAWPRISADLAARIAAEALRVTREKIDAARAANALPGTARFDIASARYRLRAFMRVKHEAACPPRLVWSAPSAPYALVPWFEPGAAAPAAIPLPSLADFKKLKPNVSFSVPPSLQAFMQGNDAGKLVKGEGGKGGPALDVQWICSFSLPIITLCAFIVLNIFLSLFNLIFSWMAFIKICLPIPLPKKGGDGG
jgi:hypothetical protein